MRYSRIEGGYLKDTESDDRSTNRGVKTRTMYLQITICSVFAVFFFFSSSSSFFFFFLGLSYFELCLSDS